MTVTFRKKQIYTVVSSTKLNCTRISRRNWNPKECFMSSGTPGINLYSPDEVFDISRTRPTPYTSALTTCHA